MLIDMNVINEILNKLSSIEQQIEEIKSEPVEEIGGIELAMGLTGYTKRTVQKLCQERKIPHFKKLGRVWFSRSDLIEWITSGKVKTIAEISKELGVYKKGRA